MAITYQGRRQEYLDYLGGKCVECDATEDLQVDHIDWRSKSFNVMKRWGSADQKAVYAELDKCQLLCGPHHKIKTAKDQNEIFTQPVNHGTIYAWMKRKCKCNVCLAAKRAWNDARNERRRNANPLPS